MRLLIDSLIAVMLVGILAGVLFHHRRGQQEIEQYRQVHEALADLHEQTLYHAALAEARTHQRSYPLEIDRAWFGARPPVNTLAPAGHAWIDTAPEGDDADHPPDPILREPGQAGFWYNPATGVFRARVPEQASEPATLELYNRVNGAALLSLSPSGDGVREPQRPTWGRDVPRPVLLVATPVEGPATPVSEADETSPEPESAAAEDKPKSRRSLLSDRTAPEQAGSE